MGFLRWRLCGDSRNGHSPHLRAVVSFPEDESDFGPFDFGTWSFGLNWVSRRAWSGLPYPCRARGFEESGWLQVDRNDSRCCDLNGRLVPNLSKSSNPIRSESLGPERSIGTLREIATGVSWKSA